MSNSIEPIHLLLIEASSNEAEKTVNNLRNHGFAVRATRVLEAEKLQQLLEQQSWDLLLTRREAQGMTAEAALQAVKQSGRDLPILLLLDSYDDEQALWALKNGMRDAVSIDQEERLRLIIEREIRDLRHRRSLKRTGASLQEAEKRCHLLLDSSRDAIAYIHDGMHIYANKTYVELFAYEDVDDMLCLPVMDMVSPDSKEKFKSFLRDYSKRPTEEPLAFTGVRADGEEFEAFLTFSPARYDDEECIQMLIRHGGDSAELEEKLKQLSARDALTGLFNQSYLQDLIQDALTSRSNGEKQALIYFELDQFEQIKNEHGITARDQLVREAGIWLQQQMPENATLARLGDDAFGVFVQELSNDEVREKAKQWSQQFAEHMLEIEGQTVRCTFSIGIYPITDQTREPRSAVANAYSACLRVKKDGGNGVKMYSAAVAAAGAGNVDMVEQIQSAIETGKLTLWYQPMVKLHGETRDYYQVLLRIPDEKGNYVSPETLFPIAEKVSLASKLDRWVIAQSLRELQKQRQTKADTRLFISLSEDSLKDENLLQYIAKSLQAAKLPNDALVFQFSETAAAKYLKRVITLCENLKKLRGLTALTEYGSSEEYHSILNHLRVDFVSLDSTLAPKLSSDEKSQERLQELAELAHTRGKISIVPKVEDAAALATLYPAGVHYIHGYYLQAPMESMTFEFGSDEDM